MIIKEISLEEALPIRQQAMWPDRPLDFVRVPDDQNAHHLGLFVERKLISVVSVFPDKDSAQFRKFGTLPEFRRKGYGSKLLVYMISFLQQLNIKKVWCNARMKRVGFYENFGFKPTDQTFEKSGMKYVIMKRVDK